jgi:hypothetical protein
VGICSAPSAFQIRPERNADVARLLASGRPTASWCPPWVWVPAAALSVWATLGVVRATGEGTRWSWKRSLDRGRALQSAAAECARKAAAQIRGRRLPRGRRVDRRVGCQHKRRVIRPKCTLIGCSFSEKRCANWAWAVTALMKTRSFVAGRLGHAKGRRDGDCWAKGRWRVGCATGVALCLLLAGGGSGVWGVGVGGSGVRGGPDSLREGHEGLLGRSRAE